MLLETIGIHIRVAMKFSKCLDPNTTVAPVTLILNSHTVRTGAAPVQVTCQGLGVVLRVQVEQGHEGGQRRREWLTYYALLGVGAGCRKLRMDSYLGIS